MKKTISGYVTFKAAEHDFEKDKWGFVDFKPDNFTAWGVLVQPHTIEVDVPDNFDPRPEMVKALEAEKQRVRAKFAAEVKRLDDRIASLLAIEMA